MPVTARLSKLFYDNFGDEVADELVNWLSSVDAGRRDELRELNETNFARFEASVKQQFAEANARLERRFAEHDVKFERRFAEQDAKMEKRFAEQDAKFETRFASIDAKIDARFAQADARLERALKEHTRWMFVAWSSLLIAIIGMSLLPQRSPAIARARLSLRMQLLKTPRLAVRTITP